jgi:hypothetical protein
MRALAIVVLTCLAALAPAAAQDASQNNQLIGTSKLKLVDNVFPDGSRVQRKPVRRAHRGQPRTMPADQLERYCENIAAMKVRTTNRCSGLRSSALRHELILGRSSALTTPGAIHSRLLSVAAARRRAPATIARFRAVVEDPTTFVRVTGLDPFQPAIVRKPHEFDQHLAESARRPGRHRPKTKHSIGRYSDLQGKAAR